MARQDTWDVTATLDGVDLGTWDKKDGGDIDSDDVSYKPGGMAPRISLGGTVNVANVTISRLYDLSRDQLNIHWLISRVGKGWIVVKQTPLDNDGNNNGYDPLTYQGVLKRVGPPPVDSEGTDAALLELEFVPAGLVT
jgi:hypothetical protein